MKAKRSISGKIVFNTILMMVCMAAVFIALMTRSMKSLTDTVLSNALPSMIKTASQSVEGSMHMLADRIFMIGDNEVITTADSTPEQKKAVLNKAQSGIEFTWLGIYDGEFLYYLVGSYNYDILSDVLNSINISANGETFTINAEG